MAAVIRGLFRLMGAKNGPSGAEGATVTRSQALFRCVASASLDGSSALRNVLDVLAQRSTRNVRCA